MFFHVFAVFLFLFALFCIFLKVKIFQDFWHRSAVAELLDDPLLKAGGDPPATNYVTRGRVITVRVEQIFSRKCKHVKKPAKTCKYMNKNLRKI